MLATAITVALSAASPGMADDCPAIICALEGDALEASPAARACFQGKMSQAVYEETETCIGRFKGGVALRASLNTLPAYAHLAKQEMDDAEQALLADFAKMQDDPPDGVDLAHGRAAFERARQPARAALSLPPAERYAMWREISPLTPRCMNTLRYRIGLQTVERKRRDGG